MHRAELAPDGTLTRVKIADPSFFNWPALPVALTGTIVPDFHLANKSFGLSYPGTTCEFPRRTSTRSSPAPVI